MLNRHKTGITAATALSLITVIAEIQRSCHKFIRNVCLWEMQRCAEWWCVAVEVESTFLLDNPVLALLDWFHSNQHSRAECSLTTYLQRKCLSHIRQVDEWKPSHANGAKWKKLADHQNHQDSSSGDQECVYKTSWQLMQYLLRYFPLDQSAGPTYCCAGSLAKKYFAAAGGFQVYCKTG